MRTRGQWGDSIAPVMPVSPHKSLHGGSRSGHTLGSRMKSPHLPGRTGMSIGFETSEIQLRKLCDRLQGMSDEDLIQFGRTLRRLKAHRVSSVPDGVGKLADARAGWRRGHPRGTNPAK